MTTALALLALLCTVAAVGKPETDKMSRILNGVTATQLDAAVRACHPSAGLTDDEIDDMPDEVVFSLLHYCRGTFLTDDQIIKLLHEGSE